MRALWILLLAAPAWGEPTADEEVALKAREAAALREPVAVDWAAAEADRRSILSESLQKEADAVPLPVLVPPALAPTLRLVAGPTWYAANLRAQGVRVVLHAFGHAHHRPELLAEQKAAGYGTGVPRVTRVHALLQVAFERYGLAFTLDAECDAPESDVRCRDEAWLLSLVDALVVAGGRPAGGQR